MGQNLEFRLHLKELEILSKMTCYLKYDKIALVPFCFQVSPLGNKRGYLCR
jgi:hypothetical protein